MPSTRRIGAKDSKTRAMLLDAAEQMMLEDGYAAVTSRKLGARAGLKPQLVHYYFRTMDELFLEVFRRRAEQGLERFRRALQSDHSLKTVWEATNEPEAAAFNIEFAALANHRKDIRTEIAHYAARFRKMQLEAIAAILEELGVPAERCPPLVVLVAMTGVAQVLALEKALGFETGHAEAVAYVEQLISRAEG